MRRELWRSQCGHFCPTRGSVVEFIMLISCVPMGLSHIVRPGLWIDFFARIHAQGYRGAGGQGACHRARGRRADRSALHQVRWSGPGILLTIYGWAQFALVLLALFAPDIGMRSLAMAQSKGERGFVAWGMMLMRGGTQCRPGAIGLDTAKLPPSPGLQPVLIPP